MHKLLLIGFLAGPAFAQTFGVFTHSDDFGAPPLKRFRGVQRCQRAVQNHRLRQSPDTDSPLLHPVIRGNGRPGVQFRSTKGGDTNTGRCSHWPRRRERHYK